MLPRLFFGSGSNATLGFIAGLAVVCGLGTTTAALSAAVVPPIYGEDLEDGGAVTIPTTGRDRPLALAFWASWCLPCRGEAKVLEKLFTEEGGNLDVVGISIDRKISRARYWLKKRNVSYRNIFDTGKRTADAFGVKNTPTLFLIGTDGTIQYRGRSAKELYAIFMDLYAAHGVPTKIPGRENRLYSGIKYGAGGLKKIRNTALLLVETAPGRRSV